MGEISAILLLGLNAAAFYFTDAFRCVSHLGPGEDAPPFPKFIAASSLFLWLVVIAFGRYFSGSATTFPTFPFTDAADLARRRFSSPRRGIGKTPVGIVEVRHLHLDIEHRMPILFFDHVPKRFQIGENFSVVCVVGILHFR